MSKKKLALVMMIKNEEKRIEVSFDSVKKYTEIFILLDTGSVDNTINICKEYCKKNNITLHLKEEAFVNFEVSRNVLLDFADQVLKEKTYLLQLDCNDELKEGDKLTKFVETFDGHQTGFHLRQKWWTGASIDTYLNIRLCLSHSNWRYYGAVHEYISNKSPKDTEASNSSNDVAKLDSVILYQDRTKDDDKSFKRFNRDKILLYAEYVKNPKEPRTLFYLGQTCACLNLYHEAYQYYILRTKEAGFLEEQFHAYQRLGELAMRLKHPWEESLMWYLKAYGHSGRAEPLVLIAEYYTKNNSKGESKPDFKMAYMYAQMACKLIFPYNQILFINKLCYTDTRWHILGVCAYHIGRYLEGKHACLKAISAEDKEVDMNNLLWYLRQDKYLNGVNSSVVHPELVALSSDKGEMFRPEDINTDAKMTEKDALKKGLILYLKK